MRTPVSIAVLIFALTAATAGAEQEPKLPPSQENSIRQENSIGQKDLQAAAVLTAARHLFHRDRDTRHAAIAALKGRGNRDIVPALIQANRFVADDKEILNDALRALTGAGEDHRNWRDWMLWQEAHPELKPFAGFAAFKADVFSTIDPNFRDFLYADMAHDIRLEEITFGGVRKDGIPALDNPKLIKPAEADYLTEDELVFGVSINGDARAYPLRILDWHEMFNDTIGGVPVALAYCTLCASGILFETQVAGRDAPFVFGSSGLLYRSNKLMFDRETNSLWNQFTGRPVTGKLTRSGIELKVRPVAITSWSDWRQRYPKTRVLSLETGHSRPYIPGKPYGAYFASPDLMFPTRTLDKRLQPKDYVFAVRDGAHEKAWSLKYFQDRTVINDKIDDLEVVLIGNAKTRTVRAYASGGLMFISDEGNLIAGGRQWQETENALSDGQGKTLRRLGGHVAYWFAWSGYKPKAALADPPLTASN